MELIIELIREWWWVALAWGFMFYDELENIMKKIKGFTLIELMIVIAIIGILASIVIPALKDDGTQAEPVPVQQTEREKFEQHVDDDCVARYGKFACDYDAQ